MKAEHQICIFKNVLIGQRDQTDAEESPLLNSNNSASYYVLSETKNVTRA